MTIPRFDIKAIGGESIARQLEAGPGAIRAAVRAVLADVGDEILARAQALAPKRTGVMASRIVWYFGSDTTSRERRHTGIGKYRDTDRGPVIFTARPTGTVAHLIERGVNATRKQHARRITRTATIWTRKGQKGKTFKASTLVKAHPFKIAAHPFFMPAVESVGGPSGVTQRLQSAMSDAGALMREAG